MLSKSRDALIIHLFALLHAGLALGCRALGLTDEIVLTLLTMLLVVVVCLRRGMSAKFMAFSLILVNIIGFGIAKAISSLLGLLFSEPLVVNPISTFITTEIVGWGTYMIAGKLAREGKFQVTDSSGVRWLLLAFVIVIAVDPGFPYAEHVKVRSVDYQDIHLHSSVPMNFKTSLDALSRNSCLSSNSP